MKNLQHYKKQLSFMTNAELIAEYESVSELAPYSDGYKSKRLLCREELKDRNLEAVTT